MMKEIIAILRPAKVKATKQKLADKGFVAYTEMRVDGRGKQKGLRYASGEAAITFLPRKMLTLFVKAEDVNQVVQILIDANKTGEIGDGKIFVCPSEDVLRIRTDERSLVALA